MDDEEPILPEGEKPRFLLPDGCKDLIDALRQGGTASSEYSSKGHPDAGVPMEPPPVSVALPDLIDVKHLASALHLRPYAVIASLVELNIFATLQTLLTFEVAAELCARHGVRADRLPDPPA